jgi:hypothetical protein
MVFTFSLPPCSYFQNSITTIYKNNFRQGEVLQCSVQIFVTKSSQILKRNCAWSFISQFLYPRTGGTGQY